MQAILHAAMEARITSHRIGVGAMSAHAFACCMILSTTPSPDIHASTIVDAVRLRVERPWVNVGHCGCMHAHASRQSRQRCGQLPRVGGGMRASRRPPSTVRAPPQLRTAWCIIPTHQPRAVQLATGVGRVFPLHGTAGDGCASLLASVCPHQTTHPHAHQRVVSRCGDLFQARVRDRARA